MITGIVMYGTHVRGHLKVVGALVVRVHDLGEMDESEVYSLHVGIQVGIRPMDGFHS